MKQKSIASICKPAVTLLAAAVIILLCRKGIIPVHTILLTDNGGRHNPYFAKTPPVPGDNSHHSDPYWNVIINP